MTFEPWGPDSATPAIFTVQLVLLKRCSTEYSAGIMANMELDDFGVCFFLPSLFYLGLIYYTLIIPSKALTQVSPLQLRLQSREPSCHQSSGDISGHGVLSFVFRLFAFCLPTYLPAH